MTEKIELKHPEGKKAVSMDVEKYFILKSAIIECLKFKTELTHKELKQSVKDYLSDNNKRIEGSVPWHLEWVKLDLEAKKEIKRTDTKSGIKYILWK